MNTLNTLRAVWDKKFSRKDFLKGYATSGIEIGTFCYLFDVFSKYRAFASRSREKLT